MNPIFFARGFIARRAIAQILLHVAIALALGRPASSAHAQTPDQHNAATWYARAFADWQRFREGSPQQYELIINYAGDPSQPITPEIRAALTSVQGAIADFRRASQEESCDFTLDYSQGFELMLPHLGQMRDIARAMRADVAVRIADGDTSGAAAELASMYRSADHFGDDRVLISSLVGQSVFTLADSAVQLGLDTAAFNAADAATLLGAANQLGVNDPFQYVEAVGMEQEIALVSLEKYRGPEGAQMLKALAGGEGDDAAFEALGAMDDAAFDEALTGYDAVMTRMNAVFSMTDKDAAAAEMKKIEAGIKAGEFGPLAGIIAPALGRVLERKFAGEQMLKDRIATLSALASGEQKPEDAANAALWYLRAIEMWEALPKETTGAILGFGAKVGEDVPQPVIAALVDVQPALDVFREAASKRRCDFAVFVHRHGDSPIAPHYAPGMYELTRALRADAVRLLKAGERETALDRLAAALRASTHMGGDVNIAVCRTAHVNFNAALDLIETAQTAHLIDIHSAPQLAEAASRVSRKDPFGYLEALTKTREPWVRRRPPPKSSAEDDVKEWDRISEFIRHLSGDQTFFALVMFDERSRRFNDAGPPANAGTWQPLHVTLPETIERLNGVIDAKAVEAIRAQYDELGPRLTAGEWDGVFVGREITPAARLVEGLTRARGDLRRATRLLMLADDAPPEEATP